MHDVVAGQDVLRIPGLTLYIARIDLARHARLLKLAADVTMDFRRKGKSAAFCFRGRSLKVLEFEPNLRQISTLGLAFLLS